MAFGQGEDGFDNVNLHFAVFFVRQLRTCYVANSACGCDCESGCAAMEDRNGVGC